MLRIAIVAGESSGDLLAEGLIQAIRRRVPDVEFEGIAGPRMIAQGCKALFPMERLSVMGLVEVLGRYRELHAMREQLAEHLRARPPDIFIGVDAPDFNLGLEARLRSAGIPTVHYVSPSIWAWRRYRVRKIARAVDLMLTLFPFEANFYQKSGVTVRFVGHPFADVIPDEPDTVAARRALGLPLEGEVLALLPGSRGGEVARLAPVFLRAAAWLRERRPGMVFAVPLVNDDTRTLFENAAAAIRGAPDCRLYAGRAREVMAAADVVVLASGTATLEAMLLKRPMVAAYRMAPLTYWIVRHLLRVPYVTLPNLLAGETLVPELLQDEASAENIGRAVVKFLDYPDTVERLQRRFAAIHRLLRCQASERAAEEVLSLVGQRPVAASAGGA